ncbi:MAG: PhoH family protein [Pseudomonadota bacterium]
MNIARIERNLPVQIIARGNELVIHGETEQIVETAAAVIEDLHAQVQRGLAIGRQEVDAAIRMVKAGAGRTGANANLVEIKTERRLVIPRSPNQARYIRAIENHDLVFGLGPAGTGKTYLAVAAAVAMMKARQIDRIILSRPAVEAGERLGFLPGDLKEKVDPYLRPLYDALHDMLSEGKLTSRLDSGEIEIAPLAYMRGRTLSSAFVILDEAQNTTAAQMKMFLTRLGENSRMVVTGDPSQTDLPRTVESGLVDAVRKLEHVEGVSAVYFDRSDVVRHPLVSRIIEAYDDADASSLSSFDGITPPLIPAS